MLKLFILIFTDNLYNWRKRGMNRDKTISYFRCTTLGTKTTCPAQRIARLQQDGSLVEQYVGKHNHSPLLPQSAKLTPTKRNQLENDFRKNPSLKSQSVYQQEVATAVNATDGSQVPTRKQVEHIKRKVAAEDTPFETVSLVQSAED